MSFACLPLVAAWSYNLGLGPTDYVARLRYSRSQRSVGAWTMYHRPTARAYTYYRKRGSASYIVREVLSVRERDTDRERERQRRKWRHHCRAKIGDEFTLSLAKNSQWGLFTKWRRSGSAGHLCTRVHAGCMAGCVRRRKTHLRRATFCSFCLNTLRVILTDDLCVWRTWKIKPEKELEQDFSFFFGSMTVSMWDSEQCTTLQGGLYSDTDCGCRRQATPSLGFCFLHSKEFNT